MRLVSLFGHDRAAFAALGLLAGSGSVFFLVLKKTGVVV